MPKSASTFLTQVVSRTIGGNTAFPHPPSDKDSHGFDQISLMRTVANFEVVQSHYPANDRVIAFLSLRNLDPVVFTRNIFDALVSASEHSAYLDPKAPAFDLSQETKTQISIYKALTF